MLQEGYSVYIQGTCASRFQNSNFYSFNVTSIEFLQTVKEKNITSLTITLDPSALTDSMVMDLTGLINDNPGNTELYFEIRHPDNKGTMRLRSRTKNINLVSDIVAFIRSNESMSYYIN